MAITEKVYVLHHVNEFDDGHEDIKIIGVYSTEEKASEALEARKNLPGFRDNIAGFSIDEYTINRSGWGEGFTTLPS
jgi:hypothetical protein